MELIFSTAIWLLFCAFWALLARSIVQAWNEDFVTLRVLFLILMMALIEMLDAIAQAAFR